MIRKNKARTLIKIIIIVILKRDYDDITVHNYDALPLW